MAVRLLAFLLIFPPLSARGAVPRAQIAPRSGAILTAPLPLSYSVPVPALGVAPGAAAAPSFTAPLSAPTAAPAAALPAPAAAVSSDFPAAAFSPAAPDEGARNRTPAVQRARARNGTAVKRAQETADALRSEASRAVEPAPDLLARDYAVFRKEHLQSALSAMTAASATRSDRAVVNAVFAPGRDAQKKIIADIARKTDPHAWSWLLANLYGSLRAAYFSDLKSGVRAGVSSHLHDLTALFLDRIAVDLRLPDAARDLAREMRARYLTEDRLLTALAWSRREKERVAAGRRELAAEVAALPELAEKMETPGVGANSENRNWTPPGPDASAPSKTGSGVSRWMTDLEKTSLDSKDRFALFQLARGRWNASRKIHLSARAASREKRRWNRAAASFARSLSAHEDLVDYILDHTLRMNFGFRDGGVRGRLLSLPHPSISLRENADGYLLQASFETDIQDPAVVAAFRRSIESYWTRTFEENGRSRRFTAKIAVRVLGPNKACSPDSLCLADGGTVSGANAQGVLLSREFEFSVPAHEFGHVMGLPDEYENKYFPESMKVVNEQDRSSLMAHGEGVLQSRHFIQIIEALRQAGRLGPA